MSVWVQSREELDELYERTGGAVLLVDPRDVKSVQEALNVASGKLAVDPQYSYLVDHLAKLSIQTNSHRPVGNNGKHGNLHTTTCGCEDK